MQRGAGQTVIEDRYRRLAAERHLLRWSAFAAACFTLLRAAWLNGIYVFQEVIPPYTALAATGLGLLAFFAYVAGAGGGQAQRERLPLLRASMLLNIAAIGMAIYNFWVDHLGPEGTIGDISTTASYGELVRHFSRFHKDPDADQSLEALGTFMDASLDTIAEVMRFAAVFAASLYLRDKAAPKVKKRA